MAIQKNKKIMVRICEEDCEKIKKIKSVDSNFNLSHFLREKILERYSQVFPTVGTFRIG